METRSLAIGLVAIVAAFAAAFGLAKSGGSKTETAGAGVKAQSIKVAPPAAVAGVEVGGTLPALKAERKPAKKAKKAKKKASAGTNASSTTNSSSTTNTTTTQQSTTQPNNTQPNNTKPNNTKPNNTKPNNTKPNNGPISSGGGVDG